MLSLLCEVDFGNEPTRFTKFDSYSKLKNFDYVNILGNSSLFNSFVDQLKLKISDLESNEDSIKNYLNESIKKSSSDEEKFNLISVAVSCLQLFVRSNWLGPLPFQINSSLPKAVILSQLANDKGGETNRRVFYLSEKFEPQEYDLVQEKLRALLVLDGETLYPIVKCVHFLYLAKIILIDNSSHFENIPVSLTFFFIRPYACFIKF